MSNPTDPNFNPYASPAIDAGRVQVTSTAEMHKIVKQFRSQMHSLGAFWIIIGLLGTGLIGFQLIQTMNATHDADPRAGAAVAAVALTIGVIMIGLCLGWVLLGILTCFKQIWAVYVGLVLSYLSVVGNLITLNIIALVILAVAILQAHRVINWAADMKRRRIPLNTKPQDLTTPIGFTPPGA
jgi:hypothetical protein